MAKDKLINKDRLSQYTSEMMEYIKSKEIGLSVNDVNGLIDEKLIPVNKTIENKVEKVDGMGLSTNDYTDDDKSKVNNIPEDAKFTDTVYDDTTLSNRIKTIEDDYLSYEDKTELTSAINTAKQEAITTILGETVDTDFDTLQEVADWIQADTTNSAQLITRVTNLENDVTSHKKDTTSHVTSSEKTTWNTVTSKVDKVNGKGLSTNDYTNEEKTQVATNKTDISLLKEEVEDLQNDIVTTTSATLYGSKSGGLRVKHMIGKSKQRQLSGKNLYNVNDISSSSNSTVNNEGWITATIDNTSGTSYAYAGWLTNLQNFLKVSTQYAVVVEIKEISNGNLTVNREVTNEISQFETIVEISKAGTFVELMSTKNSFDDSTYCLRTYFRVGAGMSGKVIYRISVLEDTTVTAETFEYEPYCGGTPSPNPEYRQSIHHTGDCVEMMQGMYNYATGIFENSSTTVCNKNSIPCTSGDTIKIEVEEGSSPVIIYYTDSAYLAYRTVSPANVIESIVPSGATRFNFYVYNKNGVTPENVGKVQLTINGKYVVQIVENWKNCLMITAKSSTTLGVDFSVDKDKGTIACKGTSTGGNFEVARIDCKKYYGKKICLSGCPNVGSSITYWCEYVITYNDGTPNRWGIRDYGNSNVITIDENMAEIVYFIVFNNGYTANNLMFKPQLEIGDKFTGFEPYTEKVATIFLDEPLREGDRLVKVDGVWNVERHKKKVIYNASDFFDTPNAYDNVVFYLSMKPTDMLGYNTYNTINMLSNKFIRTTKANLGNTYDTAEAIGKLLIDAEKTTIWFGFKKGTTLEEAQSIGEIELQYKLATPTYEILDTASQIALNSLKTFDTVTYLSVDSVTQPAELEVEFGKSISSALTLKANNDNDNYKIQLNSISSITTDAIDSLFTS